MEVFLELKEWYTTRKIVLENSIHNIKDDPNYRWRLEALAKAEQNLVKIVKEYICD